MNSLPGEENPKDEKKDLKIRQFNSSDKLHNDELDRLRQILFSKEIALIDEISKNQKAKQFNTKKVSEVLAESIILRSGKDKQLNIALEPVVDEILKTSLRHRKNDFVNVLFPLIGPVIRKSITETFLSMLGNFSQTLEVAFSWRGLKWRFEAWRSGKPFSEIVLLHTVLYRVEQIFLIHAPTGLALSYILNEEVAGQDVDMVSGMLTAIQDFVRDSFSESSSDLDSLKMGDMSLIIEKNDSIYLASVVRGTPPVEFRRLLQDTLDLMMIEYEEALVDFNGDTAPFLTAVRYLQPLLLSRYAEEEKKLPFWAKIIPIILILTIFSWISYAWYKKTNRNALLEKAVLSLNGQPGIMVTNVIRHKDIPWEVLAFKDALAKSPEDILITKGFSKDLLAIKSVPFISYHSSIILKRINEAISIPGSVNMKLNENGTLILSGKASMAWMLESKDIALTIPGVKKVDISGLRDPLIEQVIKLVKNINGSSIEFPLGKDKPVKKDIPKLAKLIENLVELEKIAKKSNLLVSLTVYGHADSIGSEKRNYEISQARAKTVAASLYARGSNIPISLYGMGSQFSKNESKKVTPYEGDQKNRRIELHVSLARSVSADNLFDKN